MQVNLALVCLLVTKWVVVVVFWFTETELCCGVRLFCWYPDFVNCSVMFILLAVVLVCYENPTIVALLGCCFVPFKCWLAVLCCWFLVDPFEMACSLDCLVCSDI
jgi:hypothetical protein